LPPVNDRDRAAPSARTGPRPAVTAPLVLYGILRERGPSPEAFADAAGAIAADAELERVPGGLDPEVRRRGPLPFMDETPCAPDRAGA